MRIEDEVCVVEGLEVLTSAEVDEILGVAVAPDFLPILRLTVRCTVRKTLLRVLQVYNQNADVA